MRRVTLNLILIITLVWLGFIIISAIIANFILTINISSNLLISSILRAILGSSVIAVWLWLWYLLVKKYYYNKLAELHKVNRKKQ